MIVYGEQIDQPVVLADIDQNAAILGSPAQMDRDDALSERPSFEVALFWGPEWLEFLESGEFPNALNPDQANQHGKFYPATGSDEAVLALEAPSILAPTPPVSQPSPEGLQILEAQGIPVRLDPDDSSRSSMFNEPLLWGIGITALLLAGSIFVARARDPGRKLGADSSYEYR